MSFVVAHRDRFGVEPILRVLEIPVSTFYGWVAQQRAPCQRRRQDAWLLGKIRAVHKRSGGTYGAPRVHAQLRRDGIRASRKRWRCSTRQNPQATPAPDLVNRDFTAPAPNRLWVADLSRIPTGEGPLWLASVRADTELVLGALEYAIWGRGLDGDPGQRRLIHHSDRGAQYTAIRFTQRLVDAGIQPSMGSIGDSFDNALAENFFSILKVERIYRTSYRTREEAELDLVRFIDGWYNPHRIQRELGWLSPDEYEEAYYTSMASGGLASPAGAR